MLVFFFDECFFSGVLVGLFSFVFLCCSYYFTRDKTKPFVSKSSKSFLDVTNDLSVHDVNDKERRTIDEAPLSSFRKNTKRWWWWWW